MTNEELRQATELQLKIQDNACNVEMLRKIVERDRIDARRYEIASITIKNEHDSITIERRFFPSLLEDICEKYVKCLEEENDKLKGQFEKM